MEMQKKSELNPYSAYLPDFHLLSTQEFLSFVAFQPSGLGEGKTQVQFKFFALKKKNNKIPEFKELNLSHHKKCPSWKGKCSASSCEHSAVLEPLWFGSLVCYDLFCFCLGEFFQWLSWFLIHLWYFLFWTHGVTYRVPFQIQGGAKERMLCFPLLVAAPFYFRVL